MLVTYSGSTVENSATSVSVAATHGRKGTRRHSYAWDETALADRASAGDNSWSISTNASLTKSVEPVDPVALYDTLDRAHDKGPLRPAQIAVLTAWFTQHQGTRDVIVKLHTGQGKSLIGLLMLQSRLNAGKGPALYLCPDNFLIEQTCEQAKEFAITTCNADPNLPDAFLNGEQILVTSVPKTVQRPNPLPVVEEINSRRRPPHG